MDEEDNLLTTSNQQVILEQITFFEISVTDGKLPMESYRWKVTDGKLLMESYRWKVTDGCDQRTD